MQFSNNSAQTHFQESYTNAKAIAMLTLMLLYYLEDPSYRLKLDMEHPMINLNFIST